MGREEIISIILYPVNKNTMARHIKATLITLLILGLITGLMFCMIKYPSIMFNIFVSIVLLVVIWFIYMLVYSNLKK